MDSEDQVFEIVDYTAATPLEKDLLALEDIIRKFLPQILINPEQLEINFFGGNTPEIGYDVLKSEILSFSASKKFRIYLFVSFKFKDNHQNHQVCRDHKIFEKINSRFGVSSFFLIEEHTKGPTSPQSHQASKKIENIENLLSFLSIALNNVKELINFPIFAKENDNIFGRYPFFYHFFSFFSFFLTIF